MVINQFNRLADEFEFRKISENELNSLRDLTSKEFIKHLQIPIYKIPSIIHQVRKYLRDEIKTLVPVENLPQVLEKLHCSGYSLGILTSNSIENVSTWLNQYQLDHLFNFIREESNFFSKKSLLKKILKTHNIEKSQAFYIGDETRDIEAAKQSEIFSIAVTWGFNSEKALSQSQPDHIARVPEDILTILRC